MRVRFLCGYYSDLAHNRKQRRPEDYWDAYFFCWGVKVGKFKRSFNIHDGDGKIAIGAVNFHLVRRTFGDWIKKSVAALEGGDEVLLVPVPSKDGIASAKTYRTLEMAQEALKHTERWSRFPAQNGGLAKVDSGFGVTPPISPGLPA